MSIQPVAPVEQWIRGKPFTFTAEQAAMHWFLHSVGPGLPYCGLCAKQFAVGDGARFIFANSAGGPCGGNFFACSACDKGNDACLQRRRELWEEFKRLHTVFGSGFMFCTGGVR